MTAPSMRQALERCAAALQMLPKSERDVIKFTGKWSAYGSVTIADILDQANAALATLSQPADARERIARILLQTLNSGSSNLIQAFHAFDVADAILAAGLVQDETTIRADERERCAKVADDEAGKCNERSKSSAPNSPDMYRYNTAFHSAANIAAAIRRGE